jgi:hypothetical protein
MDKDHTFYAGGDCLLGKIMNSMNNGTEIIMHGNQDSCREVNIDKAKVYDGCIKQA